MSGSRIHNQSEHFGDQNRSGLPPWVGILRNLDPTNIVWGIWGIRVENSNLIRHSLNARQTITKTNKRHIDFGMSREHPPTLKSSSRANFHKVWHSHQTLLFTHSHFSRSHFTRSHFTHSHFTRSHFTRSHEKIEETLFCDMWLPFHSPPPSGCLMRLFPFSRAVDYITAPPRTTEHHRMYKTRLRNLQIFRH